jgi:prophage maintenance system killer protein
MGRAAEDKPGDPEALTKRSGRRYSDEDDRGRVLPQVPRRRAAGAGEAGPPGFPTLDELKAVNRAIHDDAGQPERYALDQPSPLQSSLDRALQAYEPSPEGIIRTAALLVHGIAQAQGFRDGNRRTAYIATKSFLEENGLGFVGRAGKPDHMLVRYLNQLVDSQGTGPAPDPRTFERLFLRRLRRHKT